MILDEVLKSIRTRVSEEKPIKFSGSSSGSSRKSPTIPS